MIEPAFRAMGLDWRYLTVEVRARDLHDAVRGARAMNWVGFNCTIPHKIAVIPHLDDLTPAAQLIGAVNCVVRRDHSLLGDNTDGKGFIQSLETLRPAKGVRAVLLGAGGAARAIAVELALAGAAELTFLARNLERSHALAAHVARKTGIPTRSVSLHGDIRCPENTDLFINATSIGLFPDVSARVPLDFAHLPPHAIVCDVIPNPPRTRLIQQAAERGHTTLDGLGMLVNQGVISIRLWTGMDPDPTIMRQALEAAFEA